MEFASDERVRAIRSLTELFRHVLHDEVPVFVSDEGSILDVSMAPVAELLDRCSAYYKTAVSLDDLRRPLWQSLPELESRRNETAG
jgi:hypothetical protein